MRCANKLLARDNAFSEVAATTIGGINATSQGIVKWAVLPDANLLQISSQDFLSR